MKKESPITDEMVERIMTHGGSRRTTHLVLRNALEDPEFLRLVVERYGSLVFTYAPGGTPTGEAYRFSILDEPES